MTLPFKEGIGKPKQVYRDIFGGPPLQKLKNGGCLADLIENYVLFTYAPLCAHGDLKLNPVQEWINLYNMPQVVFVLLLDTPILEIHSHPKWDCMLWAVERSKWASLSLHIGTIALIDRASKTFTSVICQEIPIRDVKLNMHKLETVNIYTFSPSTNKCCYSFKVSDSKLIRPTLTARAPLPDNLKFANALFGYDSNPYQEIQP